MADSIEVRLDQLTQAIKGLYAKSSMSQGEIYNALTALSQRYENLSNVSSEKIAMALTNEFRKTLDVRYEKTNQYIKDLELLLKSLDSGQNPKMSAEITRLLNDTTSIYSKLNAQDIALEKIYNLTESFNGAENSKEIMRLSQNFAHFASGFENITDTLNKNFAEFLSQIRHNTTKEEFEGLNSNLNAIAANISSIITEISTIDSKYKDFSSLIGMIQEQTDAFNSALREIRVLSDTVDSLKNNLLKNDKTEFHDFALDFKTQMLSVKEKIEKIASSSSDISFKTEVFNLSNNVTGLQNNVIETKDEIKGLSENLDSLSGEIKNIHNLVNDEILFKARQQEIDFERYLNSAKDDMKLLLSGLNEYKKDLRALNEGNIKILQEPLERALSNLGEQDFGLGLNELSDKLKTSTSEIQEVVDNLEKKLNEINNVSGVQVLNELSRKIPEITDKLEVFRNHVVSENSASLGEIKTTFSEVTKSIKSNIDDAMDKIQQDTRAINSEIFDNVKVDIQKLVDYLADSTVALNEKIQNEFTGLASDFGAYNLKQSENIDKIIDKITSLEVEIEGLSNIPAKEDKKEGEDEQKEPKAQISPEFIEKLDEILSHLKEPKNDTLEQSLQDALNMVDSKIEQANIIQSDYRKELQDTFSSFDSKIEKTNLQQINNAKELLDELQLISNKISERLSALEERKDNRALTSTVSIIADKLDDIRSLDLELQDAIQELKTSYKQKPEITPIRQMETPKELLELSGKIDEYLTTAEFENTNVAQEVLDNLAGEFSRLESAIKRISTNDEHSNYSYTLEDVESDLAKIRIAMEKQQQQQQNPAHQTNAQDIKDFSERIFEKVSDRISELRNLSGELKNISLENTKLTRDVEGAVSQNSSYSKDISNKLSLVANDLSTKIDTLSDRMDDIQKNGFEDIKTRLFQSEKSKTQSEEMSARIEGALKYLIKNAKMQEERANQLALKLDTLQKNQQEGFNPTQFIDIFYDSMTQTKMLTNKVEAMEDRINEVSDSVAKLIRYIEQP